MRARLLCLLAGALLLATWLGCQQAVDVEAEKAAIKAVFDSYLEVLKSKDIAQYEEKLWAAKAENVVISSEVFVGWEEWKAYVDGLFKDESFEITDFSASDLKIRISNTGEMAWFAAFLDEAWNFKGESFAVKGNRWSGVLEKVDGKWKFVHAHFSAKPVVVTDEVKKAINETNLKFEEAIMNRDAATLASYYTEDAIVMPANSPKQTGREEIQQGWQGAFDLNITEAKLTTVSLTAMGDFLCEEGAYEMTVEPEGREAVKDEGKYIVIWKQADDGTWKLYIDIWNSNLPAQ